MSQLLHGVLRSIKRQIAAEGAAVLVLMVVWLFNA
jgi:hypothetical protein